MSVTPFSWKLEYPRELTEQFGEIVLSKPTSFRYSSRIVIFISVKSNKNGTIQDFPYWKKISKKNKKKLIKFCEKNQKKV